MENFDSVEGYRFVEMYSVTLVLLGHFSYRGLLPNEFVKSVYFNVISIRRLQIELSVPRTRNVLTWRTKPKVRMPQIRWLSLPSVSRLDQPPSPLHVQIPRGSVFLFIRLSLPEISISSSDLCVFLGRPTGWWIPWYWPRRYTFIISRSPLPSYLFQQGFGHITSNGRACSELGFNTCVW